jgi:hypothetical protein
MGDLEIGILVCLACWIVGAGLAIVAAITFLILRGGVVAGSVR